MEKNLQKNRGCSVIKSLFKEQERVLAFSFRCFNKSVRLQCVHHSMET